jgi:LPS-assembly protein
MCDIQQSGVFMRSLAVAVFALMLVHAPAISRAQSSPPPPNIQADEVIFAAAGNNLSVTARGNVEIHYNGYILMADRAILDRNRNTAIAEGNVQLKDPKGAVTRADRMEMPEDLRDALLQSPVEDKSR